MKVSLHWLREYVSLPPEVSALVDLLTLAGVEVEGIETRGVAIAQVVVAEIKASAPHPNADRLSVCQVGDGSEQARQIVCGAKNYRVGDHVPLALPGAVLPGGLKIKASKLRGVESQGMLCSERELGIADDAEGLLILAPDTRVGAPLSDYFPPDVILDLEVTPNRADLLSHLGIAREIAALSGVPVKTPLPPPELGAASDFIRVEAPELCPWYTARRFSGVQVAPSPPWLRQRLEAVGLRSINNVVDITNYVMLELGQPLHAFDAAQVRRGIVVRPARAGEELVALDGRTYALSADQLVIADEEQPLAIAGIMGGEKSGVTSATREIILESAWFLPSNIRRSVRRLGLSSDSSYRFERGIDPEMILAASQRAADLLVEFAGATPDGGLMTAGALPAATRPISLRPERCRQVLGIDLSGREIDDILSGFGLRSTEAGWSVPSFRSDLTREIDLIEEVVRVHGIGKIAGRVQSRPAEMTPPDRRHDRDMQVRTRLANQGFSEARTVSLISPRAAADYSFDGGNFQTVRNPLSEDQSVLRPSLLPGLLQVVAGNVRAGARRLKLFEVGRVFRVGDGEEQMHLALVMTGSVSQPGWNREDSAPCDFFDLKGAVGALPFGPVEWQNVEMKTLAVAARILRQGRDVGFAGQMWPAAARAIDVSAPLLVAEVALGSIGDTSNRPHFAEINRFPAITRDIALIVPAKVTHAEIVGTIASAGESLLEGVILFDVFTDPTGTKVAADEKSMAYSLTYRAQNRTLTVDEANAAHTRLKERLKTQVGAALRE